MYKDEWRKFVSPTCPGPRSAHAVVATPAGGGKLFLFGMVSKTLFVTSGGSSHLPVALPGGEFSSLYQNSFHHYRDFWCFDIPTQSWDRIDTKVRPTARSGHRYGADSQEWGVINFSSIDCRMAVWKHYIVLFGGFYDPGYTSTFCQLGWLLTFYLTFGAANYLNDLWVFDMQEYKWKQIVMKDNERKPSWASK